MVEILTHQQAAEKIFSGATVMIGGFGNIGNPKQIIDYIAQSDVTDLTVIANDLGTPNVGLGRWVRENKIKMGIGSYFTYNAEVAQRYREGKISLKLMPQGTYAEAIRAGGSGIGGFYTKIGLGTEMAEGEEIHQIDGEDYIFIRPLKADIAVLHARKADEMGNLVYEGTARNFNPLMAMAAKYTIVEVEEIVPAGSLSPEEVITPFIFVDALVKVDGGAAK